MGWRNVAENEEIDNVFLRENGGILVVKNTVFSDWPSTLSNRQKSSLWAMGLARTFMVGF
jgi:hypothetical protein